jgi:hypothetical protein
MDQVSSRGRNDMVLKRWGRWRRKEVDSSIRALLGILLACWKNTLSVLIYRMPAGMKIWIR